MSAPIAKVRSGSIAEEMEIKSGDVLLSINGQDINDVLDYQFYAQDDILQVEIRKSNQEIWSLEIEKSYDEELGLEFAELIFDRLKSCQNRCLFCFVDQLPDHMRTSLYIKDDDYRHSFIYGNFITLTNLSEADWKKIAEMHLSPLYVSVHCIQSDVRQDMLKNPRAGNIKQDLQRLQAAGIEAHTQIVLCPGWNDGEILLQTIQELRALHPSVASVGIVPVGLTGYRERLPHLSPVSPELARNTVAAVDHIQQEIRNELGLGFVYLADEFYLQAGLDIPPADYYDDYCQIENGIGLARWLLDEFSALEPSLPPAIGERTAYILTGRSGELVLQGIVARLNRIEGLSVKLVPVSNSYFGGAVSVAGLLTGRDIISALGHNYRGQRVILPAVLFREGQRVLLDDTSLNDIATASQADIRIADGSACSLVEAILDK